MAGLRLVIGLEAARDSDRLVADIMPFEFKVSLLSTCRGKRYLTVPGIENPGKDRAEDDQHQPPVNVSR